MQLQTDHRFSLDHSSTNFLDFILLCFLPLYRIHQILFHIHSPELQLDADCSLIELLVMFALMTQKKNSYSWADLNCRVFLALGLYFSIVLYSISKSCLSQFFLAICYSHVTKFLSSTFLLEGCPPLVSLL